MIKGKFFRRLFERLHLRCVTPCAKPSTHDMGQERDANRVSAGIALRVGEDTNQSVDIDSETRLLLGFTAYRLLHRLAHLAETTGQSPAALKGRVPATHKHHSLILKDDDRVDGQDWCVHRCPSPAR